MPYIIALLAMLAFIVLWCYTVKKELNELKQSVENSVVQVELIRNMISVARHVPELQYADKMLQLSLVIYSETVKKYNRALRKPFNRPPALLLGFKIISEHI